MEPENQAVIKAAVETYGADDLLVVVGAVDEEALEVAAQTVVSGDPSYVGPLAGIQLGLPVMHIFEDDVRNVVDADVYREQVGLVELAVDADAVRATMTRLRAARGA